MAIGVFDSGLGGLTIVRSLREIYPKEKIIYYGDTLRVPYGEKKPGELIHLADRITGFLISEGATLVIDACNTTSALALDLLKEKYGDRAEIIGVVNPGASKAAKLGKKKIGLMATQATVNSGVYQKKIFSKREDVDVHTVACSRLVPYIEAGDVDSYQLKDALGAYLAPLQEEKVDTLVMGCTHYPFLRDLIQEIMGEDVQLIDPGVEVVGSILHYKGGHDEPSICYTSFESEAFSKKASLLFAGHGFSEFQTLDIVEV
ncbi:glutamate racemase [Clostridia bacterium]|nr:glutamate racemase [Clostridia bacterium]